MLSAAPGRLVGWRETLDSAGRSALASDVLGALDVGLALSAEAKVCVVGVGWLRRPTLPGV